MMHMHVRRMPIHLFHKAGPGEVRQPNSCCVAVAIVGQISDKDPYNRGLLWFWLKNLHHATDDVCIHACPADILAHPIHD